MTTPPPSLDASDIAAIVADPLHAIDMAIAMSYERNPERFAIYFSTDSAYTALSMTVTGTVDGREAEPAPLPEDLTKIIMGQALMTMEKEAFQSLKIVVDLKTDRTEVGPCGPEDSAFLARIALAGPLDTNSPFRIVKAPSSPTRH